jgi:hypothetical protein
MTDAKAILRSITPPTPALIYIGVSLALGVAALFVRPGVLIVAALLAWLARMGLSAFSWHADRRNPHRWFATFALAGMVIQAVALMALLLAATDHVIVSIIVTLTLLACVLLHVGMWEVDHDFYSRHTSDELKAMHAEGTDRPKVENYWRLNFATLAWTAIVFIWLIVMHTF